MKRQLTLLLVALGCGLWVVCPDPFPIIIDDIIFALGGAAAILKFIKTFFMKNPA